MTMKHIIPIAALAALAAIAWHVGGMIPVQFSALGLGAIFGVMAAIPAVLIATTRSQRVRHDHYHHTPTEAPREPQKQPLRLPAKPTRYIVIANRPALPTVAQSKLEVKQ